MAAFSAAERRALERAVAAGEALRCPACGAELSRREVPPSRQLSYVRRRVWLLCPACKRTGAVEAPPVRGDERP